MSEKRFKLVDRNGIYQILDLHKDGRHILTGEENVDLLNEQQATIDYLKDLLGACKLDIKNARQMLERWEDE